MHSFWRKVGSQFERLLEGSAVPGAWQPQWPVADSEGTAALEEQKCFSSWESLLGCSSSAALLLCCVEIFLFFSTMLTFRPLHVFFFLSGTVFLFLSTLSHGLFLFILLIHISVVTSSKLFSNPSPQISVRFF